MLVNRRGKRLWLVDATGLVQPVTSSAEIGAKPRGWNQPDWWVEEKEPDWTPPPPTSLLSMTAANVGYVEAGPTGGAGGMKIGAGHKPQPYDEHGRYTGPGGGQAGQTGQRSSTVLSALSQDGQEGGQDEESAPEKSAEELEAEFEEFLKTLEAERQQTQGSGTTLDGVLLADSGQIRSDAGGGLSKEDRRLEEKKFTSERLVQNARADLGNDKWAPKVVDGDTKNQCNVFVAEKLRETGAHVPNVGGKAGTFGEETSDYLAEKTGGAIGGQLPSANDWHKGVPGYERVKVENGEKPMPGDVASNGKHVGIVSREGCTISVTARGENAGHVVENNWGFRENQEPVTFWRYAGSKLKR